MKQMLQAGKSVVGTMICEIRQPSVMQLMRNAGFDFVIIDNEHGVFNPETIADLSRTARYLDLTCIVRVPDMTYSHIAQALDGGAMGIMLPRVYSAAQVREALQMMKFPPVGQRGNSLSRGYTNFKSGSPPEAMAKSNAETILIVQVETKEAVDNIEEIVQIPGVDATLVGPNDLAIALGVPGQLDSAVMREAIDKMIAACQQNGVYPAIHMNDLSLAVYWAKKGMRVLSSSSETGLMVTAGAQVTATIRQAFEG
jgi:2-dehydro-3-deoxyglucarate aldolase/4-hydroxy-2-oxoheptanedioate aldolase